MFGIKKMFGVGNKKQKQKQDKLSEVLTIINKLPPVFQQYFSINTPLFVENDPTKPINDIITELNAVKTKPDVINDLGTNAIRALDHFIGRLKIGGERVIKFNVDYKNAIQQSSIDTTVVGGGDTESDFANVLSNLSEFLPDIFIDLLTPKLFDTHTTTISLSNYSDFNHIGDFLQNTINSYSTNLGSNNVELLNKIKLGILNWGFDVDSFNNKYGTTLDNRRNQLMTAFNTELEKEAAAKAAKAAEEAVATSGGKRTTRRRKTRRRKTRRRKTRRRKTRQRKINKRLKSRNKR